MNDNDPYYIDWLENEARTHEYEKYLKETETEPDLDAMFREYIGDIRIPA